MISLPKNNKLYWGIGWGIIILLVIMVARMVPRISYLMDALLVRASNSIGGYFNVIMLYMMLVMILFTPFLLLYLKPVSLIALSLALLPFLSRSRLAFEIYGYTAFDGNSRGIYGIALIAPLLLAYLSLRYPVTGKTGGWWLPSSKGFWALAISGVLTQFFFFPPTSILRIAYSLIGAQLLWYLIVVRYTNTIDDVCKIIWGMVIGVAITAFITAFTAGYEQILNPVSLYSVEGRIASYIGGTANEYPGVVASTICLLPILFYRANNRGKILVIILAMVFIRELLIQVTRGGFLSVISVLGYLFIFRYKKKYVIAFISFIVICIWIFGDDIIFFLTERPITQEAFIASERPLMWKQALEALMTLPTFFIGLGMATLENSRNLYVHYPHQGFLYIWVHSGLVGLLGFCFWFFYSIWVGIKKIIRSHVFEEKMVLTGLVLSLIAWTILLMGTVGNYLGGQQEVYVILTVQVGMLVALGQKPRVEV
jgi:hypothetical protein